MVSFLRWFKQPGRVTAQCWPAGSGTGTGGGERIHQGPVRALRQDTGAAVSPSMLVTRSPQSLYYDCNPAIKSYSCSMRSQLNEWESTLCLCVAYKPQSWTRAKTDTRLLPSSCPLWRDINARHLRSNTGGIAIHPTRSLLIYWIL